MTAVRTVEYGDPTVVLPNEILRTLVGSGVHGIAIEGTDDRDEMGVYIAPPEHVLGLGAERDSYIHRTQPEGARSGPGDVDLVLYSLGKYLRLAIKGNPTALLPLFAPDRDVLVRMPPGHELRRMRHSFLSRAAVERFLGYMHSQHERMMGRGRQGRVPNRPELIERYGWDVKYGAHALRLAYQGYEVAREGTLTLPLPEEARERVLAVKRGEVPRDGVSNYITILEAATRRLLDTGKCPLPDEADLPRIESWAIDTQRRWWGWRSE